MFNSLDGNSELAHKALNNFEDVDAAGLERIRITVAGAIGVGKSVIIKLIEDALTEKGFSVSSLDDELRGYRLSDDRISAVASSTSVEISPVYVLRNRDVV